VRDGARHLYLHLPFCASRCGYCDFVTVVGRGDLHRAYVDSLLGELDLERQLLAVELESIYLGGGTPSLTAPRELERLLAALPPAREVTVEANPETVTPSLAALLSRNGVDRVSIGAQTFNTALLDVLDRRARPGDVRAAMHCLSDAGIDNRSLDLIYGIPGQAPADLARDLDEALALEPEHISAYELEAKPGTRFTHAHGAELLRQADELESYIELVVDRLTAAGYRWYETANFCRLPDLAGGRDLRARHNLGYWLGRDYLGLGVGAVSTIENRRWRNAPSLHRYLAAHARRERPARELETLSASEQATERVMLGLRLDEPLSLAGVQDIVDPEALARLAGAGLAGHRESSLTLTPRGRLMGGGVTARLLA
jgi:oxygen-independent coproporphyrinogen III oxidase